MTMNKLPFSTKHAFLGVFIPSDLLLNSHLLGPPDGVFILLDVPLGLKNMFSPSRSSHPKISDIPLGAFKGTKDQRTLKGNF